MTELAVASNIEENKSNENIIIKGFESKYADLVRPEELIRNPLLTIHKSIEELGDICYLQSIDSYAVADTEFIKYILMNDEKLFTKSESVMEKISVATGKGLSTLTGETWRKQRKLAAPKFKKRSIGQFYNVFHVCISEMLNEWNSLDEIDITREMKSLTIRIVIQCLFSEDIKNLTTQVADSFEKLQEQAIRNLWNPVEISQAELNNYQDASRVVDSIIYSIISERRRAEIEKDDLLGMFMSAVYEDTGAGMSDEQLRHEVMNIFLAGHETTANSLSFTFYELAHKQQHADKLNSEISEILDDKLVTSESISNLTYCKKVYKESLRLFPPSWAISRIVKKSFTYKGHHFVENSEIIISQWSVHHSESNWNFPNEFDPDRFDSEKLEDNHGFTYIPFGVGPRHCIGLYFAQAESISVISRVIKDFNLECVPDTELNLTSKLFLTSDPGIKIGISKRV
jgi:cytochrome P450